MADYSQEYINGEARRVADYYYASSFGRRLDEAANLAEALDYPAEVRAVSLLQAVRQRAPGGWHLWGQLPLVVVEGIKIAHEAYSQIKEHQELDLRSLVSNQLAHVAIYCGQVVDDLGAEISSELPSFHRDLDMSRRIAALPADSVSILPILAIDLPSPAATRNFVIEWQPAQPVA